MERDGSDLARVVRKTDATLNPEHYSLLMQIESLNREIGEGLARLAQLENQPLQVRKNGRRK